MPKYWRRKAILAKIETTAGTDSTPTGVANAMQMTNVKFERLAEKVSRDLVLPYMGHQGVILTGHYGRLTGEVEIAGAGAAGTAPKYGPLLRACAMAEVITAGTDVKYSPISSAQESVSIYYNADGVNHTLLYCRGTFTMQLTPKQIPRFVFTLTGLVGTAPTDTALPSVTLTGFQTPVEVSKAFTTGSLHGYAGAIEGLSFDLANQIEPRFLINAESVEHTDRQMTGSATVEQVALATKDWIAIAKAHTKAALSVTHGVTAGNIVQFDAPKVQIDLPTEGETQKILTHALPLMFTPNTGNDEFVITVK